MIQEAIYKYKFDKRQLFNILLGIGAVGSAIVMFLRFDTDNIQIVLICFLSFSGIIPLLITIHFLLRSKNIIVSIMPNKSFIEVNYNGINKIFRLEDIKYIEIHEHKGLGLYEFDFDYAKYTFNDGKFFIVTSFMTDGYYIPEGIEPTILKEFLPIIWKQTNINI